MARLALLLVLLAASVHNLAAQQPAPAFEVASIRPNKSGEELALFRAEPGGRLTITNITVRDLILRAYQIRPFELSDGPHWIGTERYDVLAKAE